MASLTVIVCLLFIDLWGNIDYIGLSKAGAKIIVVDCNKHLAFSAGILTFNW